MSALREAAQQALEALEYAQQGRECPSTTRQAITALRAALAQQDEPDLSRCPQCNGPADNGFDRSFPPSPYLCKKCMAEPVQDQRCRAEPRSDGDFVCDCKIGECPGRSTAPPKAEPVDPVAWLIDYEDGEREVRFVAGTRGIQRTPLYAAPPQRKPLTEEEIESCRQQGYAHAGLGAPFDFGKAARAVEKASWEKNHGQA